MEPGPAEDVFEGQSRDAPVHHGGGLVRGAGGGEDQLRLVLGEDTARGTERGDNGISKRGMEAESLSMSEGRSRGHLQAVSRVALRGEHPT